MSNPKVDLRSFEKYTSTGYRMRIVNQREIFEWLKEKGPMTESKIFEEIYNFYRGGFQSNKKYAECLRRLLSTGKIARRKNERGVFEYYTTVENFSDEFISEEVSAKSKIKNFDIVQTRNGNVYLACVDEGVFINLEKIGYNNIDNLGDDLTLWDGSADNHSGWDVMVIYRAKDKYSLQCISNFKNCKESFIKIWERPQVKVYSYTNAELKAKLGISPSDKLVVED